MKKTIKTETMLIICIINAIKAFQNENIMLKEYCSEVFEQTNINCMDSSYGDLVVCHTNIEYGNDIDKNSENRNIHLDYKFDEVICVNFDNTKCFDSNLQLLNFERTNIEEYKSYDLIKFRNGIVVSETVGQLWTIDILKPYRKFEFTDWSGFRLTHIDHNYINIQNYTDCNKFVCYDTTGSSHDIKGKTGTIIYTIMENENEYTFNYKKGFKELILLIILFMVKGRIFSKCYIYMYKCPNCKEYVIIGIEHVHNEKNGYNDGLNMYKSIRFGKTLALFILLTLYITASNAEERLCDYQCHLSNYLSKEIQLVKIASGGLFFEELKPNKIYINHRETFRTLSNTTCDKVVSPHSNHLKYLKRNYHCFDNYNRNKCIQHCVFPDMKTMYIDKTEHISIKQSHPIIMEVFDTYYIEYMLENLNFDKTIIEEYKDDIVTCSLNIKPIIKEEEDQFIFLHSRWYKTQKINTRNFCIQSRTIGNDIYYETSDCFHRDVKPFNYKNLFYRNDYVLYRSSDDEQRIYSQINVDIEAKCYMNKEYVDLYKRNKCEMTFKNHTSDNHDYRVFEILNCKNNYLVTYKNKDYVLPCKLNKFSLPDHINEISVCNTDIKNNMKHNKTFVCDCNGKIIFHEKEKVNKTSSNNKLDSHWLLFDFIIVSLTIIWFILKFYFSNFSSWNTTFIKAKVRTTLNKPFSKFEYIKLSFGIGINSVGNKLSTVTELPIFETENKNNFYELLDLKKRKDLEEEPFEKMDHIYDTVDENDKPVYNNLSVKS